MLNQEQIKALESFKTGNNIFLSGGAGCGKSYTLKAMINWCNEEGIQIGVTASTGAAAVLIGGRTIHSFLGIGPGKKSSKDLALNIIKKNVPLATKLKRLEVLFIDEISMLNAELLDKISEVLSIIRTGKPDTPFGNIQVVFIGDFCQLPPVTGEFAFKSAVWKTMVEDNKLETIELTIQERQNNDIEFKNILNALRWGKPKASMMKLLRATKNNDFKNIIPTILFATNSDIDTINTMKYKKLIEAGAEEHKYESQYSNANAKLWGQGCRIAEHIELCQGAQVVCMWNVNQETGLINGTRGVIVGFSGPEKNPIIKCKDGKLFTIPKITITSDESRDINITFMPLKLAWALSIHKSQGMTLDAVVLDLGHSIFEYGQAYTALSRVRDLESVKIIAIEKESFRLHPDVKTFYNKFSR